MIFARNTTAQANNEGLKLKQKKEFCIKYSTDPHKKKTKKLSKILSRNKTPTTVL